MNLRDLHYLATLAETGHMGRAAVLCNVSQPTMSMQLRKLEDWLGLALFERRQKSLFLTPEGAVLAERARHIVREAEALVQHAKSMRDPLSGEFRLGAFPTLAPYYLPKVVPTLSRDFEHITWLLVEDKTARLIDQLKAGTLDAALLALPAGQAEGLSSISLFSEPFLLAMPATHPLAQKKQVQMQDIKHVPLLLLEEGHCLREQALEVCSLLGVREVQGFRATSLETLRQMVAAGVGLTLMPQSAAIDTAHVVHRPFVGAPYQREIGLVFRATSPRQKLIALVAETLRTAT